MIGSTDGRGGRPPPVPSAATSPCPTGRTWCTPRTRSTAAKREIGLVPPSWLNTAGSTRTGSGPSGCLRRGAGTASSGCQPGRTPRSARRPWPRSACSGPRRTSGSAAPAGRSARGRRRHGARPGVDAGEEPGDAVRAVHRVARRSRAAPPPSVQATASAATSSVKPGRSPSRAAARNASSSRRCSARSALNRRRPRPAGATARWRNCRQSAADRSRMSPIRRTARRTQQHVDRALRRGEPFQQQQQRHRHGVPQLGAVQRAERGRLGRHRARAATARRTSPGRPGARSRSRASRVTTRDRHRRGSATDSGPRRAKRR